MNRAFFERDGKGKMACKWMATWKFTYCPFRKKAETIPLDDHGDADPMVKGHGAGRVLLGSNALSPVGALHPSLCSTLLPSSQD